MNAQKLTPKQAVQYISSRAQISSTGKYELQVLSVNHHEGRVIINLKAQDPKGLAEAKELLHAGEYDAAANTNMSTNVYADASFIPTKGEYITCMVAEVPTRDGGSKLGVVSISEIKAKATSKVSLGDEFANLLAETETEESSEVMPELG